MESNKSPRNHAIRKNLLSDYFNDQENFLLQEIARHNHTNSLDRREIIIEKLITMLNDKILPTLIDLGIQDTLCIGLDHTMHTYQNSDGDIRYNYNPKQPVVSGEYRTMILHRDPEYKLSLNHIITTGECEFDSTYVPGKVFLTATVPAKKLQIIGHSQLLYNDEDSKIFTDYLVDMMKVKSNYEELSSFELQQKLIKLWEDLANDKRVINIPRKERHEVLLGYLNRSYFNKNPLKTTIKTHAIIQGDNDEFITAIAPDEAKLLEITITGFAEVNRFSVSPDLLNLQDSKVVYDRKKTDIAITGYTTATSGEKTIVKIPLCDIQNSIFDNSMEE